MKFRVWEQGGAKLQSGVLREKVFCLFCHTASMRFSFFSHTEYLQASSNIESNDLREAKY
jgi:hypothetical protein